jgi:branched-chain amino acid transport system permease protein
MSQFLVSLISGIALGGTYALIALGIVLIFRATDTFNFAHGQFMLLGAYLVAKWQGEWKGAPLIVVLAAGIAVVAVVGWLLFRIALRRIIGAPPFIGVIATLGFAAVADAVMTIIFGPEERTITFSFLPEGSYVWAGAHISKASVYIAIVSLFVAGVTALVIAKTRVGAKVRAAGQDVLLASQSGINVHRVYAGSWAAGCALAAFAGITYASTNVVTPDMVSLGLVAFPAILLGGLDSIEGAIVGGVVTGLIESFTASYWGGQWTYVTTYSLLLVVILVRPAGLFGTKTIVRV